MLTRLLDRVPGMRVPAVTRVATPRPQPSGGSGPGSAVQSHAERVTTSASRLAVGLVAVGAIASFAMGANDVSNATGALVGTHTLSPLPAGLVGGAGLALGVLTWGGRC